MKKQNSLIVMLIVSFGIIVATSADTRAQTFRIDAAVEGTSDPRTATLFYGSEARTYIGSTRTIMEARPNSKIEGRSWSGWNKIDAATQIDNKIYLFSGRDYIRLDGMAEGYRVSNVMKIAGNFAGNWPGGWDYVDAAVNLGNGNIYFFRGKHYIRYNISSGRVENNPTQIVGNFAKKWPNWDQVDAALNLGNGRVAFFKGDQYFLYVISTAMIEGPFPVIPDFGKWYVPGNSATPMDKPEPPNANFRICASEGTVCRVTGTKRVAYGYNRRSQYIYKTVSTNVSCNNQTFGADPVPNKNKVCYIEN